MSERRRRGPGEGTVGEYETASGGRRYFIKYMAPQVDGSRKAVMKRGFTSKREATTALREQLASVDRGAYVQPSKLTVGAWLDEWLPAHRVSASTRASYEQKIRLHIKPHIGNVPLAQLTGARLTAMYRELEADGRVQKGSNKAGLSARTVRYIHTIVKAALDAAVRNRLLVVNPAGLAVPPSAKEARPPEMHPWTAAELSDFLNWAREQTHDDAVAWRTLAYTGMRRGELLALRWSDIDLRAGRITVTRSLSVFTDAGEGERLTEGPTKTTGSRRTIDLDPQTVETLKKHRAERGAFDLRLIARDTLVFASADGQPRHPNRFTRTFTAAVEHAIRDGVKLTAIRLHDLRHTHATLLLAQNVPVKVVSERLGHAGPGITLGVYAHVMPGMQQEAVAKFAALMDDAQRVAE